MKSTVNALIGRTAAYRARPVAGLMLSILALLFSFMITITGLTAQTPTVTPAPTEERQRGMELYRQQKFADSAKLLEKFLKQNRSDAEAWHYLGLALLHEPKRIKDASKAFETALKLQPSFVRARAGLSYSLLLRYKLADANREAQAALSLDRDLVDAHFVIGVVNLRTDAREEALARAETTIKLDPQYAPGYLLKSQALVSFAGDVLVEDEKESREARRDRYGQAAQALEKYLQLEPDSGEKQRWTEQLESLRFYVASRRTDKGNEGVLLERR
jgi:tetratricopeptide (TPR) repeat protein